MGVTVRVTLFTPVMPIFRENIESRNKLVSKIDTSLKKVSDWGRPNLEYHFIIFITENTNNSMKKYTNPIPEKNCGSKGHKSHQTITTIVNLLSHFILYLPWLEAFQW